MINFSLFMVYLRSRSIFFRKKKGISIILHASYFKSATFLRRVPLPQSAISKDSLKKRKNRYLWKILNILLLIARECEIAPHDHLFELVVVEEELLFSEVYCFVALLQWILFFFVLNAKIVEALNIECLTFICDDIQHVALNQATCVYLYGTCLSDK